MACLHTTHRQARIACRRKSESPRIDVVELTRDTLTGRGGLVLFVCHLRFAELWRCSGSPPRFAWTS